MTMATLLGALDERIDVTVIGSTEEIVERVAAARPGAHTRMLPFVQNKWDARGSLDHLRAIRELRPDVLQANLRTPWSCQYAIAAGILTRG